MIWVFDQIPPRLLKIPKKDIRIIWPTNQVILWKKGAARDKSAMATKLALFLYKLNGVVHFFLSLLMHLIPLIDMYLAMEVPTRNEVAILVYSACVEWPFAYARLLVEELALVPKLQGRGVVHCNEEVLAVLENGKSVYWNAVLKVYWGRLTAWVLFFGRLLDYGRAKRLVAGV